MEENKQSLAAVDPFSTDDENEEEKRRPGKFES